MIVSYSSNTVVHDPLTLRKKKKLFLQIKKLEARLLCLAVSQSLDTLLQHPINPALQLYVLSSELGMDHYPSQDDHAVVLARAAGLASYVESSVVFEDEGQKGPLVLYVKFYEEKGNQREYFEYKLTFKKSFRKPSQAGVGGRGCFARNVLES